MGWWAKGALVVTITLLCSIFMQRGWFEPVVSDSATATYKFYADANGTGVNLGVDGSTLGTPWISGNQFPAGNYSMSVSSFTTTGYIASGIVANASTTMANLYGPAYAADTVLSAPVMFLAIRSGNASTTNWTVSVIDYNPAGTAGNGTLLWSGTATSTTNTAASRPVAFGATTAKTISHGHRVKVVVTATPTTGNAARLLFYSASNVYSYLSMSETYPVSTTAITNVADYNGGNITGIVQGQQNVPMLSFQVSTNSTSTTNWTGGKLDLIGVPPNLGDVSFMIYKSNAANGVFNPATDTKISDAVSFSQASGQSYTLTTPQTVTTTAQRYFVVFNVSSLATVGDKAGAQISDASYFSVDANNVDPMMTGASSQISVIAANNAVTKTYFADFDSGSALTAPLSGTTNTACQASNSTISGSAGVVGLLNYPSPTCTVAGSTNYLTFSSANTINLYFNGPSYPTDTTVKGGAFSFYGSAGSGTPSATVTLFYVDKNGATTYANGGTGVLTALSTTGAVKTADLTSQTFSGNVPKGARLGVRIAVTASARLGLNKAAGTKLTVSETPVSNSGVDLSDGKVIPNSNIAAGSTGNVVDAFAMSAPLSHTVSALTVTGNSTTTPANVSRVYLYRKAGTNLGALEGSDVLIGSGTLSGNAAAITLGSPEAVGASVRNYLVVYDVNSGATIGQSLTGTVSAVAADVTDLVADSSSATLTLIASTTVTEGSSEPASVSIPAGAGATNVDSFGLYTNSSTPDAIQTVSVTLAAGSSVAIAAVDIVDLTNNKVYSSTAPIGGDLWRIPVSGLFATSATTKCMVRITPKANAAGTFYATAFISALTHTQSTNALSIRDNSYATVTIDAYAPPDSVLQAASGSARDTVNLNWSTVSDSNLNAPAVGYKLVRGPANNPAPADCSGTSLYSGAGLSFLDATGLGGNSYGYRLCSVDSVGNTSIGAVATATAKLPKSCNQAPGVSFVSSSNQYTKSGAQVEYVVNILNNDVGACAPVSFNLALQGAKNIRAFAEPVLPASVTIVPGGGANVSIVVKALDDSQQGDSESFILSLAASNQTTEVAGPGYAASSKPLVTAVNNFGPMLHSSFSVGTNYGTWGTTSTCNDCHIGTTESTKNIKLIRQMVTTPNGPRPVLFNRLSSSSAQTGVLGNDRRAASNGSTNICEVCHHQTKFHEYSAVSGRTLLGHNNGTDCLRCHPHKGGFKATGAADCITCHGNPPTSRIEMASPATNALGNNPTDWGAHKKHNDLQMGCTVCHNGFAANPMGNQAIELGFSVRSSNYKGFGAPVSGGTILVSSNINNYYSWAATSPGTVINQTSDQVVPTCTVYCHGGWAGGGGSNTSPTWVGQNEAACGTCHNVTNANPPTSGSHQKHVASGNFVENGTTVGGLNLACDKCHGAYRNYTGGRHINGKVEWDLSGISASATYNGKLKGNTGNIALGATPGACSNLYCHSTVQGANGLGTGTFQSVTWGGSASCGSCHANMNKDLAAPGGHVQHAQASPNFATPFDCRICHANGGTTNPLNHANGTIDITFNGYGANTVYSVGSHAPGTGYGECSNSTCHGRSTRTWGPSNPAIPLCDKCHGSQTSAGGFYSTIGPGPGAANTDPQVGAHNAHIHQRNSAFTLYTSYSMAKDCSECHIKPSGPYDAGHIDTALPAEVTFQPGMIANKAIDTNVPGAVAPSYDPASRTCSNIWCHGAAMDSNLGNGAYATVVADGGRLGTPFTPTWNVPFLDGKAKDDCTRCHSYPPPAPKETYTHFSHFSSNGVSVLKQPNECNSCHINVKTDGSGFIDSATHINGSVDKGCQACHGVPPNNTAALAFTSDGALAPGQAGAHLAHASIPAIGKTCSACHNSYSTAMMPNGVLEIGFNAMGGQVATGTFWGYSTVNNGLTSYGSSSTGTTVYQTSNVSDQNTCTVYCHGSSIGGGTLAKPQWDSGLQQVCGNCHGVNVSYLNTTSLPTKGAPTSSSHTRHSATTTYNIACDVCHGVINNNSHVDGNVTWNLALGDPRVGANASYKGTAKGGTGKIAMGAAYGSCNNIYCHSDGTSLTAPGYAASQAWGATGPLSCGACHSAMTSTGTGNHVKHVQASYACSACHGAGYLTSGVTAASHVDLKVNVTTNYSKGASFAPGSAYGSCTNTCHGSGTPVWGASLGSVQCQKCHADLNSATFFATSGTSATSDSHAGAHQGHLKASSGYAGAMTCDTCHPTTALNTASHMDGTVQFNTANISSYNQATGSCVTWCHGAGLDAQHLGSSTTPNWTSGASYLSGAPGFAECGKCHQFPPNTPQHDAARATPGFSSNFTVAIATCNGCHPEISTTGVFTQASLHINGASDAQSSGGQDCASCHSSVATPLTSGMQSDTTQYHHVLSGTTADYSGNTCLKCHVDHDISNNVATLNPANTAGVAANLRVDIAVTPAKGAPYNAVSNPFGTYTNTDFLAGGGNGANGGICISCHASALKKNLTGQKNVSPFINTTTMVVSKALYLNTMHNYSTSSTFSTGSSTFVANCSKCHSDTLSENRQTGGKTFGLHLSATRELFAAFGSVSGQDAREDRLCYACHSVQGQQIDAQTKKPVAGKDWYGSRTMRGFAEDTFTSFSTSTRVYRHNVGKYNGLHKPGENEDYLTADRHVECADCHNGHAAAFGNHSTTVPGIARGSRANTLAGVLNGVGGVVPSYGAGASNLGLPGMTGTTLYFNAAIPPSVGLSATQSGVTLTGGTWTAIGMSNTAPSTTTPTTKTIAMTATNSAYYGVDAFVSPVMTNGAVLPAQTATLTVYGSDATGAAPRLYAYAYLWNGTAKTALTTSTFVALTTTPSPCSYSITIPQTTIATANTVLVAEIYVQNRAAAANTVTLAYNATGTGATAGPSNFTFTAAPVVAWAAATGYSAAPATKEYQICFKCHSNANANVATWGGSGAAAWTDLSIEFNPANRSFHPILGALNGTGSGSTSLNLAQLKNGWKPGDVMTCTDCHATDSAASKGPHGSSVKWMLAGVQKAWPYTSAASNGASTGTAFTMTGYATNVNTVNGLFCANCHDCSSTGHGSSWTGKSGSHTGAACYTCHIRVPHGGKVSRLISTTNVPARYRPGGVTGGTNPQFTTFSKANYNSYAKSNCNASCSGNHGTATTESW